MKFLSIIKQSLGAIMNNKGRSFLTVLGIVIGIGSVIALVSLGQGVKDSVAGQINKLGSTIVTVTPGGGLAKASSGSGGFSGGSASSRGGSGFSDSPSTLSIADYNSLNDKTAHPLVKTISGEVSNSSIYTISGNDRRISVQGVSEQYIEQQNKTLASGRAFSQQDVTSSNKVAILGSGFASDYFGSSDPVGQSITINTDSYTVIGVFFASQESNLSDPNNQIAIPYTSAMKTFNVTTFSEITVEAINQNSVNALKADIQSTLLANHHITDPKLADISVLTPADLLSTVGNITGTLTSLLAGIAAISLVVGGIGIMNIMLVAVTERTKEIGLRKAVGAKTSDILWQFIIEAVLLTVLGGIIGILLGFGIGKIASHYIGFSAVVTASSILLAVGVSSIVGLVFGVYPAARAARLNPIDALRFE